MQRLSLSMLLRITPLAALALSGCLFSSEHGPEFEVGFYANLGDIYDHGPDGTPGAKLGFGAEAAHEFYLMHADSIGQEVSLFSEFNFIWPIDTARGLWRFSNLDSVLADSTFQEGNPNQDAVQSSPFLEIAGDSTRVIRGTLRANPIFPSLEIKTYSSYAGMPCTFSRFHGFVRDSVYGSLPVVVTSISYRATGDSLRLTALIDTAASRTREPRLDFSQKEFYGTMRVSCP